MNATGFLAEMAEGSRLRAEAARGQANELRARAADRPLRPLVWDRFGLIAEVKRASPSQGVLSTVADPMADVVARAQAYDRGGAAAISVLTEPTRFLGELAHLDAVAQAVSAPVMRKDFVVERIQLVEARACGASGVLLIAAMLQGALLAELAHEARELGLFVLFEAFDEADVERIAALGPREGWLLGVNTRDLRSLQVDPGRLAALRPTLPEGWPVVAESGLRGVADAESAARAGWDLALVGTALMECADPEALVRAMTAGGRSCA